MQETLNKLERKFGRYALPNVTVILIMSQVALYVISFPQPQILQAMLLIPGLVWEGQVWRLITFLMVPPVSHPIFAFFFWYLFYLMGTSLDNYWGTFQYNVYLLVGYLATVAVSFLVPGSPSSNAFLQGSVFLAFAFLNPDFLLYIFFILPVKIKWLALLSWIGYFWTLVFGSWLSRLLVLASIMNYLLFFGSEIRDRIKTGRRHMTFQAKSFGSKPQDQAFHRCSACGITDLTHPEAEFRYCTDCEETLCFCAEHLRAHTHMDKT